ncbi:MAG: TonB-dependent receptor [Acidobacteria bacterium]|nr:TonB-dependent receptor [Acidobacteriota bacterium]
MNRRLLVVVLAALLASTTAMAQQTGSIKGTIKDETGAALPGATVTLTGPDSRNSTSTGEGGYHFDNLPAGAYKVAVQLIGFGTQEQSVTVSGGSAADVPFTLLVVLRGEEVTVSASKVETRIVDAPATVSLVTSETIASSPAQNYGDLLRSVPGVNVIQTSARDINITARQATSTLSNSQLALLDGRSIYLDFFGLILWDFVPSSASEIKQIEVVRGPASAVWGANALTGVVNIITKTPREAEGFNATITGGTFERKCDNCSKPDSGTSFGGSFSWADAPNDTWSYKLSAGYFNSDPFSRPTGTIPKIADPRIPGATCNPLLPTSATNPCVGGGTYPTDTTPGAGQFGTRFENSETSQPKVDLRVDQDLSGGGRITYQGGYAGTEGIVHTGIGPFDIQSGSYMAYGKVNYSNGAFKLNVFANFVDAEAPNLLLPDPVTSQPVQLNFKTQTFDLEVGHSKVLGGKHIVTYGGNARRNNFDITLAPDSEDRNEFGGYLQWEVFWEKFRFSAGARVDKFGNLDDPVFSPRVSAIFKPARAHSIRASFNRAFRSPSTINNFLDQAIVAPVDLRALAAFGVPPALVATPFPLVVFAVGNETLEEEQLTAYEVGYTGTFSGKTTVTVAFYINDKDDDINFSSLPTNTDPYTPANPPPGWNQKFGPLGPILLGAMAQRGIFLPRTAFTYLNLGPLRNRGFEAGIDHAFNAEFNAYANFSWQDEPEVQDPPAGKEAFPTGELAFPAKNRFNAGINWNTKRFVGNLSYNHSDEAFWADVLTSEYHGFTDAYDMVNATFGVKWRDGKIVTSVKGTNLNNDDVQQHVFGDIMKRSLVGEIRVSF